VYLLSHVDDLKISHVDANVVTEVIGLLESEFGNEAPLTKSRGKVHEYLGMVIDYSIPGKVMFTMIDYIKSMLSDLPEDMDDTVPTPAAFYVFEVTNQRQNLTRTSASCIITTRQKHLFLCKRARLDTLTAVAFLSTRVKVTR
jgi:hypothetical protein